MMKQIAFTILFFKPYFIKVTHKVRGGCFLSSQTTIKRYVPLPESGSGSDEGPLAINQTFSLFLVNFPLWINEVSLNLTKLSPHSKSGWRIELK